METASIIVPVYNKEKYIGKCLDSLEAQTYRDLDIVLVNDGSTDGSLALCHRYAEKDSRIRIINQENQGVSGARNTGLECAKGTYVFWVDPDDYIQPNLVEKVMKKFRQGADIVLFGFAFLHGHKTVQTLEWDPSLPSDQLKIISSCVTGWELCCKAYRRSLWEGIRFPRGMRASEDVYVSGHIMKKAHQVVALPGTDYFVQRERHGSLTQVRPAKSHLDSYAAWTYNKTAALSLLFEAVCNARIMISVTKALLKNERDHTLPVDKEKEFQSYYQAHTDMPLVNGSLLYFDYKKEAAVAAITGKVEERTMKKALKLYAINSVQPVLGRTAAEDLRRFIISHPLADMRKKYQYLQRAVIHDRRWMYRLVGMVLKGKR